MHIFTPVLLFWFPYTLHFEEFHVGDRVRYRDHDFLDWRLGAVTAVGPPVEVANEHGTPNSWKYVEKLVQDAEVCKTHFTERLTTNYSQLVNSKVRVYCNSK